MTVAAPRIDDWTVGEIKDALRRSRTIAEVNLTAKHYAAEVEALGAAGGEQRTMAIQIRNLAAYRRRCIRADEEGRSLPNPGDEA